VHVVRHPQNLGKAASLWTGLQAAFAGGAQAVITLDADGQHPVEAIPRLIALHRHYPDRLIIAARLANRDRMPVVRRFGNGMADFWISWAAGWPIADTQSGFRLYPRALIERIVASHDRRHSFVFESEVLIDACRAGFCSMTVPIAAIYSPTARPSHYRPIADTLAIIRMVATKLLTRRFYFTGLIRSLDRTHRRVSRIQASDLKDKPPLARQLTIAAANETNAGSLDYLDPDADPLTRSDRR
jgi:hypothetical protein